MAEQKRCIFAPMKTPLVIAGPCSVESEAQLMSTAVALAKNPEVRMLRGGIWKPRTRPGSFEGRGEEGLVWLREAKRQTGLPVVVEVATPKHVELSLSYGVDALWIGARTVVDPFAVQQLADAVRGVDVTVFVKNPISPDLYLWLGAIERFQKAGVKEVAAIHRGFVYYKNTSYRNFPMWEIPIELKRMLDIPVLTDISHICGSRELLRATAQKSVDLAFDGLMVECHHDPDHALTDAGQQITPEALADLLNSLTRRSKQADGNDPMLAALRSEIDDVDDELLQLLARRMNVASQIGEYKKEKCLAIVQMDRWKQILADHLEAGKDLGLSPELINKVFEAIHQASIDCQTSVFNNL